MLLYCKVHNLVIILLIDLIEHFYFNTHVLTDMKDHQWDLQREGADKWRETKGNGRWRVNMKIKPYMVESE